MDLSKLSPAEDWNSEIDRDRHMDDSGFWACTPERETREEASVDAQFVDLARNAFDVMMRRKWSPMHVCQDDHSDEEQWGWKVFSHGLAAYVGDPADLWPDPFTALVEADKKRPAKT